MRAVPLGALPAESIGIDCAGLLQFFIERGNPRGPTGVAVLTRQVGLVHLLVFVDGFGNSVIAARPLAITSRVHIANIDFGLAMNHPLRQIFAAAGPLGNPNRGAATQPVVPETFRRSQQKTAIRCVGDRPVNHTLDTGIGPTRDALGRVFKTGFQTLEGG